MRVLIISDIHANFSALEAVLADAGSFEAAWCLGDLIGYGPDPNECIARVRELPGLVCTLGNHDAAALEQIDLDAFNVEARMSIQWLRKELSSEAKAFLSSLPERAVAGDVTLVHGSPRNPVWEYILDPHTADGNFKHFDTRFCLVGHTHIPVIYIQTPGQAEIKMVYPVEGTPVQLSHRAILNPGSVGQPRDRNPKAAYALLDTETKTWETKRVGYPIEEVQQRIIAAGLPSRHSFRLAEGW